MTQQRRVYPKLHYKGEDYVDAVFYGNEFRYGWIPTSANMRNLLAEQRRRSMRVVEGRRSFRPAQTCGG